MSSEANQEEIQNQSPNISPKNKEIEQENDNIINYPYKNQEIEKLCNNFVENLFLVNPKSYESFGANNIGVINKVNIENKGDLKIENTDKNILSKVPLFMRMNKIKKLRKKMKIMK